MSGRLKTSDGQEHSIGEMRTPIECFRCGVCCSRYQPPLSSEEAEAIATGLGMSTKDFLPRYVQATYVGYLLRQSEGRCAFLVWEEGGAKASCGIYPFRPEACRKWAPSLSRRECREGLTRLKAKGGIMLAAELYPSPKDIDTLCQHLRES